MPKDEWKRFKKKPHGKSEKKIKPEVSAAWARFDRTMNGTAQLDDIEQESRAVELKRQQKSHKLKPRKSTQPDPVPFVRPDYDDFPSVTAHSVTRSYNPSVYGFPAGMLWPVTDADAQAGRHRQPSLAQQERTLEDAFPELEM